MTGNFWILSLIAVPYVGAVIISRLCKCGASKKTVDLTALFSVVISVGMLILAAVFAYNGACSSLTVKSFEGFGLNFTLDGFRTVYAAVACIMWLCSGLLTFEYFHSSEGMRRYYVFSLITFSATLSVFLSADLITTFTFFEIMSLASYAYVAHTEKKESLRAGETYLAVAVIGGLVMLMGILMMYNCVGTLSYTELKEACVLVRTAGERIPVRDMYIAGGLILFGFGAKAGMFPLHIWLPKAHPVAPAPSSALLSGVLTKSGLFGILILSLEVFFDVPGFGLCIVLLGVVTMLIGAVLTVFSIDLKRTLACSSVSQIGFILVGVGLIPLLGEECTLALSGAMLYMVNHSLFKLTLFLCAGAIYMKCHVLDLNKLRGYGRNMPLLKIIFAVGALGISGVPLLSGYVSKTLIHEGIVEYIAISNTPWLFKLIEILFLVSGGMTFSYMMKLFHAIFVDEGDGELNLSEEQKKISWASYLSVGIPAALIAFFGLVPGVFIRTVAVFMARFNTFTYSEEQLEVLSGIKIFSLQNLKGSAISLLIGTAFFVLIRRFLSVKESSGRRVYPDRWPKGLDLEELVYRPLLCRFFPFVFRTVGAFIATTLVKSVWRFIMFIGTNVGRILSGTFAKIVDLLDRKLFNELSPKKKKINPFISQKVINAESDAKIVTSGISYGLMLICIGLCITLFYLLHLLIF